MTRPQESARLQAFIECAATLKDAASRLYAAYERLPQLIDREHEAIKTSRFADVQAVCQEKEVEGAAIELAFQQMGAVAERLYASEVARARPGETVERPRTLAECVAAFARATQVKTGGELAVQILQHLVDGLTAQHHDLEALYAKVKPRLEANKTVVATMLASIQESYKFWQEMTEQTTSNYDSQGQRQATGRNSGFKARA